MSVAPGRWASCHSIRSGGKCSVKLSCGTYVGTNILSTSRGCCCSWWVSDIGFLALSLGATSAATSPRSGRGPEQHSILNFWLVSTSLSECVSCPFLFFLHLLVCCFFFLFLALSSFPFFFWLFLLLLFSRFPSLSSLFRFSSSFSFTFAFFSFLLSTSLFFFPFSSSAAAATLVTL